MDKYQKYMDLAEPSAEFREKLKGLSAPKKSPVWQRYGAMAAALALVIGLGGWGLSRLPGEELGEEIVQPAPEIGEVVAPVPRPMTRPDITPQITEGYEVTNGETVSYYMLPYIRYGQVTPSDSKAAAPPVGVYRRDLTREELAALLDGESNLTHHLNWGDYELYAFALLNRDGSLWQLYLGGSKGDTGLEHFSLEIRPGAIPPSCEVYMESVTNEVWGTEVTADGYDGGIASSRRLSFLHGDYGYRFEVTGTDVEAIEEMASRAVRFFMLNCCPYFAPEGNAEMNTMPYDPASGVEQPAETAEPTPVPTPVPGEELGVRLSAEDVTATGLTLVLERTAEGHECMTGTPFHLERREDGCWVEVEIIPYEGEGVLAWTDIGWLFPDEVGGRYEHSVGWSLLYGELVSGQYRMAKEVSAPGGKTILYAEFEISD